MITIQRSAINRAIRQRARRQARQAANEAVIRCSAFRSLNDLLKSIREHDYVPTLRLYGEDEFDQAVRTVRRWLKDHGCKVYPETIEGE